MCSQAESATQVENRDEMGWTIVEAGIVFFFLLYSSLKCIFCFPICMNIVLKIEVGLLS